MESETVPASIKKQPSMAWINSMAGWQKEVAHAIFCEWYRWRSDTREISLRKWGGVNKVILLKHRLFLGFMYQFPYYALPRRPKTFVLKKKNNNKGSRGICSANTEGGFATRGFCRADAEGCINDKVMGAHTWNLRKSCIDIRNLLYFTLGKVRHM